MAPLRTSFLIQLLVLVLSCSLVFAQEEMLTKQEKTLEEELVFNEYSALQQERIAKATPSVVHDPQMSLTLAE